ALSVPPVALLSARAVPAAAPPPDALQPAMESLGVKLDPKPIEQTGRDLEQAFISIAQRSRFGHHPAAVALDHRQHPLHEVTEIIGQIAVDTADYGAMGEVAVIAERHLTEQKIPDRIETVLLDQRNRIDDVAQ